MWFLQGNKFDWQAKRRSKNNTIFLYVLISPILKSTVSHILQATLTQLKIILK